MCIIILKQQGICPPSRRTLKTCFNNNPDGAGFMYYNNGKVQIEKGFMSFKSLQRSLKNHRFTNDDKVVYHFRIATCGKVQGSQTHPFPVTDNNSHLKSLSCSTSLGFAHNGIFNSMISTNELSDSMMFAKEILSDRKVRANIFNEESVHSRLVEMSTSTSRLAFLDYRGRLRTFGDWEVQKETGLMFSNDDYKYSYTWKKSKYENVQGWGSANPYSTNYGNEKDEGMSDCPSCFSVGSYDLFSKECWQCGTVDSTKYLNDYQAQREEIERANAEYEENISDTERAAIVKVNAEIEKKLDETERVLLIKDKTILTKEEREIKKLLIQSSRTI